MMENITSRARAVLASTPARWNELAGDLPADLLTLQPAPGEWSALECLQHLIDTEQLFHSRIQAFLAGQDFPAFNPDKEGTPLGGFNPSELAETFARLRAAGLQALDKLRPEDLGRRVRHQELGPVTLDEMLHEWAGHDLMHTMQAEKALLQPFIAGCGPWHRYFSAHFVPASA